MLALGSLNPTVKPNNLLKVVYHPVHCMLHLHTYTQQMCGEVVDDYLAALKLVPDWFATSKTIKNLCTQMIIYSVLMKIVIMLYVLVK